jgi:hypothetical protein
MADDLITAQIKIAQEKEKKGGKEMKNLPKTIFVYRAKDGNESYLIADERKENCAEWGEKRMVGEYELKKTMTIEMVAKVTD